MKFLNLPSALENTVEITTDFVQNLLIDFANRSDFLQSITTAFEETFDSGALENLRQAWAVGDFSRLPDVEILSSSDINQGAGAFSADTNIIYLAEEYLSENLDNPQQIAVVFLEEIGHWVETQINLEDAAGDEGEIFSAFVRQQILSADQLTVLKTENDRATVEIDGNLIDIENAVVSVSGQGTQIPLESFWLNDATGHPAFTYTDWWASQSLDLQIFNENQNVTLTQDLTVSDPADWDNLNNLPVVEAGTTVSSHFIFAKNSNPGQRMDAEATISFDEPVLAFMGDPALINPSNSLFLSFTARPLSNSGTLEGPNRSLPEDTITLSQDRKTITVKFTTNSAVDPLRVLTASDGLVPSPTPSPTPEPTPSPTPEPTPSPTPEPTPEPTPSPTPSPEPNSIRIEAEDMTLDDYLQESGNFASGNQLIRIANNGNFGTATTTFNGTPGSYELTIAYNDESDGAATVEVRVDDDLIEGWTFNNSPGGNAPSAANLVERTLSVPVSLSPGSMIELTGERNGWEMARIDYLQLTPLETSAQPPQPSDNPDPNNAPQAFNDSYSTAENSQLSVNAVAGVLGNDSDGDGDSLSITNFNNTSTEGGNLALNNDGSFNYTPAPNFVGVDSFNYTISDGNGGTDTATVSIDVTPSPQQPVNSGSSIRIEAEDMTLESYFQESGNFASGNQLIRIANNGNFGTATTTFNGTPGSYELTIAYNDESDGAAAVEVRVDGNLIEGWTFNNSPGGNAPSAANLVERTLSVPVSLSPGSMIELTGERNGWEMARIDYLELTPISSSQTSSASIADNSGDLLTQNLNEIVAGEGENELTGNSGADVFIYTTLTEAGDTLTNFNPAEGDLLQFSAVGFGGGLTEGVSLSQGEASQTGVFVSGSNPEPVGTAANFLYNTTTGVLRFDGDGVGTTQNSIQIATLLGVPTLTSDNLMIV